MLLLELNLLIMYNCIIIDEFSSVVVVVVVVVVIVFMIAVFHQALFVCYSLLN